MKCFWNWSFVTLITERRLMVPTKVTKESYNDGKVCDVGFLRKEGKG